MTLASRRQARRRRDARRALAQARVDARRAEVAAGTRPGPKVYTRKDREALSVGGGRKQRRKHADRRHAQAMARVEARRAAAGAALRAATAGGDVEVVSVDMFGSSCPFVADGRARTRNGECLAWAFRYRYDRAFLEVGAAHPEYPELVGDCAFSAFRDDVTGNPYNGHLGFAEALALLADLFAALAAPQPGERFTERLANTVDLATGRGGDPDAPTLVRVLPVR